MRSHTSYFIRCEAVARNDLSFLSAIIPLVRTLVLFRLIDERGLACRCFFFVDRKCMCVVSAVMMCECCAHNQFNPLTSRASICIEIKRGVLFPLFI